MSATDDVVSTREAFGKTLASLAKENARIVALDADLASSTRMSYFRDAVPERFIQVGIAEQNMVGIAAGLAHTGLIPFCGSFATFISRRACDQVALLVGHTRLNVKLVGAYGGLVSGNNGATHQAVEDIAIMRAIPNIVVLEPADDIEMGMAVEAAIEYEGPVYLRCTRDPWPRVSPPGYRFRIGKAACAAEGSDVTFVCSGMMVSQCIEAAERLSCEGVSAEVINCATIKPLDAEMILSSVRKTGAVVTAENASVIGGLGGAVAELLGSELPSPTVRVGLQDEYGECGDNVSLLHKYGMDVEHLVEAAGKAMRLRDQRSGAKHR
ncbi:MAG: transketolase family protein [Bacillota bacterium]